MIYGRVLRVLEAARRDGQRGTSLTLLEVEVIGCFCRPQPHSVHSVVLVSWHWRVIWHSKDNLQKDSNPFWLAARWPWKMVENLS